MFYLDMYFPAKNDVPDLGTIRMTYVGCRILGAPKNDIYGHAIDLRVRNYVFMSVDGPKLSLINNAADGSKAVAADTGEVFIFCSGIWNKLPEQSPKWHRIEPVE